MKERFLILGALVLLIMGLTVFSASAEELTEVGCVEVSVVWEQNSPTIDRITHRDEGVRTAIVGRFLWIQHNSDGSADSLNNVASVEIPEGAVTAAACLTEHDVTGEHFTFATVETVEVAPPADSGLTVETVWLFIEKRHKVADGWLIE